MQAVVSGGIRTGVELRRAQVALLTDKGSRLLFVKPYR